MNKKYDVFLNVLKQNKINYSINDDFIVINEKELTLDKITIINGKKIKLDNKTTLINISDSITKLDVPNILVEKDFKQNEINTSDDPVTIKFVCNKSSLLKEINFNKFSSKQTKIILSINTPAQKINFNEIVDLETLIIISKFLNDLKIKNKNNFHVKNLKLMEVGIKEISNFPYINNIEIGFSKIEIIKNMLSLNSLKDNHSLRIIENCPVLNKVDLDKTPIMNITNCNNIEDISLNCTQNIELINLPKLKKISAGKSNLKNIIMPDTLDTIIINETKISDDFYKQIKNKYFKKIHLECSEIKKIDNLASIFLNDVGFKFLYYNQIIDFQTMKKNNIMPFKNYLNELFEERQSTNLMKKIFLEKHSEIVSNDWLELNKKDKYGYGILYYAMSKKSIELLYNKNYIFNNENYKKYNTKLENLISKYDILQKMPEIKTSKQKEIKKESAYILKKTGFF